MTEIKNTVALVFSITGRETTDERVDQIIKTYKRMALEENYRPSAPSDFAGRVTLAFENIDDPKILHAEANKYAKRFLNEENDDTFWIGCFNYDHRPAAIFALEAIKQLGFNDALAIRLLEKARAEVASMGGKKQGRRSSIERNTRRKIGNALRYEVMKRDRFACVLCGRTGKNAELVIDHIMPVAKNGSSLKENLRTLCKECNSGKGAKIEK